MKSPVATSAAPAAVRDPESPVSARFGLTMRPWRARWIWFDDDGTAPNVYGYFRRSFRLDGAPQGGRLFIAADTRYQLFVNGRFVGRGAPQSQPYFQYYDEYDMDGLLRPGENCVAALVNHIGNLPDTRGGLLLEIADAQGGLVAASDDAWRALRSAAWQQNTHAYFPNKATPYQEFFDARREPAGWREETFDDRAWPAARIVGGLISERPPCAGPWSRLVARDIPFMTADPVRPVAVQRVEESLDLRNRSRPNDLAPGLSMVGRPLRYARLDDPEHLCRADGETVAQSSLDHHDRDFDGLYAPAVVLDFGRVVTARVRLRLQGPAGGMVDMGYAERLIDGRFNIAMECELADRLIMKDGEQTFETFAWKAFRYLKLRFRSCFEPVRLQSVEAVVSTYPFAERGAFVASDDTLQAVFNISRATLQLCSNEFLMDTPWREQAQWLGDVALVTVPGLRACFGDSVLARKFFLQAGQNQHPTGLLANVSNIVNYEWRYDIADYSLWWLRELRAHYLYTGDETLLHRLYPQALRILEAHVDRLNGDGLLEDMPYWPFIDWAPVERRGVCTAYNAIFYVALDALRQWAVWRGDAYIANTTAQLREGMRAAFHDRLFDPARGVYADARIDGERSAAISEHANMAAVWAGLCPAPLVPRIVEAVFESGRSDFTEAQPFFMTVVLAALERADRFDLALELVRRRWGRRMVERGATSVYEEWGRNGSWRDGAAYQGFLRSNSHAWSACPAEFLLRGLLQLEILEPGCRKIRWQPRRTPFDYRAVYPTPRGLLGADWSHGEMSLTVPDGIEIVEASR